MPPGGICGVPFASLPAEITSSIRSNIIATSEADLIACVFIFRG